MAQGHDPGDPPIKLVNGSWRGLTQKHGIVVKLFEEAEIDDYLEAFCTVVPRVVILAAGQMARRLFFFQLLVL